MKYDSRFFQQIRPHIGSDNMKLLIKINLDIFPEPRRIIIPRRFSIANGLHNGTARQYPPLHLSFRLRGPTHGREIPHGVLGAHRLSGAAFSRNDNRLIRIIPLHFRERFLRHGVNVRIQIAHVLSPVHGDGVISVNV